MHISEHLKAGKPLKTFKIIKYKFLYIVWIRNSF